VGSNYEIREKEGIIRLDGGDCHTSIHIIECVEK